MLIDDILSQMKESGARTAQMEYEILKNLFRQAIFLKGQQVADYFYEGQDNDRWEFEKDFPNCALPWPCVWMEWRYPSRILRNGRIQSVYDLGMTSENMGDFATLAQMLDGNEKEDILRMCLERANSTNPGVTLTEEKDRFRWVIIAQHYFCSRTIQTPCANRIGSEVWGIDKEGRLNRIFKKLNGEYFSYAESSMTLKEDASKEMAKGLMQSMSILFGVFCLAISFCHCKKGVNLRKEQVDAPLIKKRQLTGKIPVSKFYTLEIEGMKEELENIRRAGYSVQKALHLCRGHFRTYSESAPLFGRQTGTFWIPMHARGNASRGQIVKDYEVKP